MSTQIRVLAPNFGVIVNDVPRFRHGYFKVTFMRFRVIFERQNNDHDPKRTGKGFQRFFRWDLAYLYDA